MWRISPTFNLLLAVLAIAGLVYIIFPLIKGIYWDNMIRRLFRRNPNQETQDD